MCLGIKEKYRTRTRYFIPTPLLWVQSGHGLLTVKEHTSMTNIIEYVVCYIHYFSLTSITAPQNIHYCYIHSKTKKLRLGNLAMCTVFTAKRQKEAETKVV